MFDIGFIELMLAGVIALLVIGPEQLPQVAVKTGKFIGHIKKTTSQWTGEINRQIENEELMAELKKQNPLNTLDQEITQLKTLRSPLSGETLGPNNIEADTEAGDTGVAAVAVAKKSA